MIGQTELSISAKIIRNTLFNSIGRFEAMGVAFLLTPYIISRVGVQRFGIWSLVLALTGYFGMFDFGLGASVVKYISEYEAQEEHPTINSLVSTGFLFYLILALASTGVIWTFGDSILRLFRVPPETYSEAHFVLLVATAILALSSTFSVFQAVLNGLQRMDVTNLIAIATSVPSIIGTVAFLELGYDLRGLVINRAIVLLLATTLLAVYTYKLLPQFRLSPRSLSLTSLRELLGYGVKVQITSLGALVNLQTNKILVGHFLGLGLVTFYELGFKVAYTLISLPMLLLSAVIPAASELGAKRDKGRLRELYRRGSKYLVLVAAPLAFFTISSARSIMLAWMGAGYERSVLVIQLLTLGFFINLLTGVGTTMARGIGKPGYETKYTLLTMALSLSLGLALIVQMGFTGALIAALIASLVGSIYFMGLFHRYLREPLLEFAKETYLKPIIACLLASLCIYGVRLLYSHFFLPPNRWVRLILLGMEAFLFLAIYLAMVLRSRYLDAYDHRVLLTSRLFYVVHSR